MHSHRVDCIRIYETFIGGALPLIVGSKYYSKDEVGHANGADILPSMATICQGMTAAQIDEKWGGNCSCGTLL